MVRKPDSSLRGRPSKKFRGATGDEQRRQLEEYKDENGYHKLFLVYEVSAEQPLGFMKAAVLAAEKKADLAYVDMGRWGRNQLFNMAMRKFHDDRYYEMNPKKVRHIRPIAIDADQRTLETVEREARGEKMKAALNRQGSVVTPTRKHPFEIWRDQQVPSIGGRRFKNFLHLTKGVRSIHIVISLNLAHTNATIAKYLNEDSYFTVDGKMWMPDNVRKIRKEIEKKDFLKFAKMRRTIEMRKNREYDTDF